MIVQRTRTVPFAHRIKVEKEIYRLIKSDIIENVENINKDYKLTTPIVVVSKTNNNVRICGDFKTTINKYIVLNNYPIPKFKEIIEKIANGKKISVIDRTDGYLQVPGHEETKDRLTITMQSGLFSIQEVTIRNFIYSSHFSTIH